jgi:hypothetical protein
MTSRQAAEFDSAPPHSQDARALHATEEAWLRLECEWRLLTSGDVAKILMSKPTDYALISTKRVNQEILGVRRGNEYRYPSFQFDADAHAVLPVIPSLIKLAHENHWTDHDLVLWLQGPSTIFEKEDRPVDHLRSDPDLVLATAQDTFTAEW